MLIVPSFQVRDKNNRGVFPVSFHVPCLQTDLRIWKRLLELGKRGAGSLSTSPGSFKIEEIGLVAEKSLQSSPAAFTIHPGTDLPPEICVFITPEGFAGHIATHSSRPKHSRILSSMGHRLIGSAIAAIRVVTPRSTSEGAMR
jgi:hypothetical protein